MRKRIRAALAALIALLLALGSAPAVFAEDPVEEEPAEEIHIRTAADLAELSKNCSLDTWSDGKRVILDNDISLAGLDFSPIPVFNGVFDGEGHEIADLVLDASLSPCGLFLETGREARIRLLTVSGSVEPAGDNDQVGGIVGVNRGALTGCLFYGTVSGRSSVGGVVGQNEATGVISSCRSSGTVFGLGQVGGIVGQNGGSVMDCENRSYINTESVDPTLRLDRVDTSSILNLIASITKENADLTANIGGVVGSNDGFIEMCSNTGTVGYLHLGSSVGGIAGRSGGRISRCRNSGDVYGRRNAGGIAGRAEPLIEISKAEDLLAGLGYRMMALSHSIDVAIADLGDSSEELRAQLEGLYGYMDPLRGVLAGVDPEDPASLKALRTALDTSLGGMSGELEKISAELGSGSDVLLEDMRSISDNLNMLSGALIQAFDLLSRDEKSEDIIADDSGETEETAVLGKISDCVNAGAVHADSNAGGVAGLVSVEEDLDWSALTGEDSGRLVQNRYSLRCIVADCVNRGSVTAKRECAGGVCGKMDFGLAIRCEGYGSVALEDGSYAGGVCGLCYGTVKACCAKCSLSGDKYVGGILGNGYDAKNADERSSMTAGCRSLVEILGKPQFAAAISGGGAGVYEDNLFVSDDYAGLDRLSIGGVAEPVDFARFAEAENVPDECLRFTLSFVVDGETVKTLPFSYGDSFDRSVYPETESRDGLYPVWDRTELKDLRFDTTVSAEYRLDNTVLYSALRREDGRPVLYADGQFQESDAVGVEQLAFTEADAEAFTVPWQETLHSQLRTVLSGHRPDYAVCTSVAEMLQVSIPADGRGEHELRYLPPDGRTDHCRLFLLTDDGWQQLDAEAFGSYLRFTISGDAAQLALVRTIQSWWVAAGVAGAVLAAVLLLVLLIRLVRKLVRRPKKQREPLKRRVRTPAFRKHVAITAGSLALAALLGAAGFTLLTGRLGISMQASLLLRDFSREETAIRAEITIASDTREIPVSTVVRRINHRGQMVTCADQFGIPLYFSGGKAYLENGRVFRLTSHLEQGTLTDLAGRIFSGGQIERETVDGHTVYRADIRDETVEELLNLFLGSEYEDLIRADDLTAELSAVDKKVERLSFVGQGVTESGKAFTLTASFVPEPMDERPVIPQAVVQAMEEGGDVTEILTGDMLALAAGWMKFDDAESLNAEISLRAEGGPLSVSTDCSYFRQKVGSTAVHCVSTKLLTTYFTDQGACTAEGTPLPASENHPRDAARLISAARALSLEGHFSCEHEEDMRIFTISLEPQASEKLAETLLPQLRELHIDYGDNLIRICVRGGRIESIAFHCQGSIRIVTRQMEADLDVSVLFTGEQTHEIPQPVREALLAEADAR